MPIALVYINHRTGKCGEPFGGYYPDLAVEIQHAASHFSIVQAHSPEQAWRIANNQLADGKADHNKHSWQENATHALRELGQERFLSRCETVTIEMLREIWNRHNAAA